MRTGISITVTLEDRRRLEGIVSDRNRAQKHIARAKVILATADGFGTNEIVRRSGLSKPNVWRWQERFMHEGVDGLLRDKTRPPGKAPVPPDTVQRVLDLTVSEPPGAECPFVGAFSPLDRSDDVRCRWHQCGERASDLESTRADAPSVSDL